MVPEDIHQLKNDLDQAIASGPAYYADNKGLLERAKNAISILFSLVAAKSPAYTEGHCKERAKPGGCQLPNVQCGFPKCDIEDVPYHTDDLAVDQFAKALKNKLREKRAKGYSGWNDPKLCTEQDLSSRLAKKLDCGDVIDIGNYAMMLYNRGASNEVVAKGIWDYIYEKSGYGRPVPEEVSKPELNWLPDFIWATNPMLGKTLEEQTGYVIGWNQCREEMKQTIQRHKDIFPKLDQDW